MPAELTTQQVGLVELYLQNQEMDYEPLKGELLDHICCMIEEKITNGENFQEASEAVFDQFRKDDLKKIKDQTIHSLNQKSLTMKKISFLVLGLMLTTVTIVLSINADPPDVSPLGKNYTITSSFGMRMHPIFKERKMHLGIDLKAPKGTPVYATANGVVEKVKLNKSGYGKHIIIKHDDSYQSLYAQLSEVTVEEGQKIKKGDKIALTGNSGTSTAPHLHYEVIKDGKRIDPELYFGP